jgi:hypothetical protein
MRPRPDFLRRMTDGESKTANRICRNKTVNAIWPIAPKRVIRIDNPRRRN